MVRPGGGHIRDQGGRRHLWGRTGRELPREASATGQAGQSGGGAAPGGALSQDPAGRSLGQGETFAWPAVGANTFPF